MADDNNSKAHASSQKFKFIDQNNRSREAATAYQSVVRSHVMTEVRRLKQSKVKIRKETSIHATTQLIQSKPDGASAQDEASTFDSPLEAGSCLTESLPALSVNSGEWDMLVSTHDGTRAFQYAFDSQFIPSTDLPYIAREVPMSELHVDLASATINYSESAAVDTDTLEHAPTCPQSDQIGERIISPAILGISRVDPFRALPIPPNREIYQLIDHYTVIIPLVMYGTNSRNPIQHQLYNIATQDPVAFHSMLAYSARQIDSMRSSQTSKSAIVYSSWTLRLIRETIREPSFECGDGLILAVALLAFAERRFGNYDIAQRHWLALGDIFRSRGGMEGLKINRWLAATLYWNCLVWPCTFDPSTMATSDWCSSNTISEAVTASFTSAEFTSFLANLANMKSRMIRHVKSGCKFPCLYSCSRRRAVFAPNGPLYKLVAPKSLLKDSPEDCTTSTNVQRTASACQLPCILYLNIVMTEYEASPELLEHYLGKLMVCVYEERMDMDISAEHLLIQILIGIEDSTAERTRRAHHTIRMAGVIQKLEVKLQRRIHNVLLESLVLHDIDFKSKLVLRTCKQRLMRCRIN